MNSINPLDIILNGKMIFNIAGTEYWSAFDKVYKLNINAKGKVIAEELHNNKYVSFQLDWNALGGVKQRVFLS